MTGFDAFPGKPRPELLFVCGAVALLGNLAPLVTMTISALITDHDFVGETISDLGRGPHKWIMDTGFYMNSGALLALAIGAAHLHLGRAGWSFGIFALALLALLTTMIGLWDAFHTVGNNPPGMTVHTWLTFGLAPLYLAGPILMASGAAEVHRWMKPTFYASAALWKRTSTEGRHEFTGAPCANVSRPRPPAARPFRRCATASSGRRPSTRSR